MIAAMFGLGPGLLKAREIGFSGGHARLKARGATRALLLLTSEFESEDGQDSRPAVKL